MSADLSDRLSSLCAAVRFANTMLQVVLFRIHWRCMVWDMSLGIFCSFCDFRIIPNYRATASIAAWLRIRNCQLAAGKFCQCTSWSFNCTKVDFRRSLIYIRQSSDVREYVDMCASMIRSCKKCWWRWSVFALKTLDYLVMLRLLIRIVLLPIVRDRPFLV